jgi:hypothetical protein
MARGRIARHLFHGQLASIMKGTDVMTAHARRVTTILVFLAALIVGTGRAAAHCDGLDGPVVAAARDALAAGDVNRVLRWVHHGDEPEIRKAFAETMAVRTLGPQAQALADRYFFETLVRIHRAGEGAPYTGLKPAGQDLGLGIPAADKAIATGSIDALSQMLLEKVRAGLHIHFQAVMAKRGFAPADVESGREFVTEYVPYIHYVERLYEAAERPTNGHYPEDR